MYAEEGGANFWESWKLLNSAPVAASHILTPSRLAVSTYLSSLENATESTSPLPNCTIFLSVVTSRSQMSFIVAVTINRPSDEMARGSISEELLLNCCNRSQVATFHNC